MCYLAVAEQQKEQSHVSDCSFKPMGRLLVRRYSCYGVVIVMPAALLYGGKNTLAQRLHTLLL
ncbi:MAG: hypothetical protein JWO59_2836 [Chloroflexi bacterium]|nr:hypothetical protein [Chloroflexota bacterium]